ncbi:BREX system P-loop protein BrxC [Gordonia bronchialis]|uniref:BREX system P-loop protein BrxC n=1 Tax=Gordonia bronchialis TaxID=2054 RepID=UPI001CBE8A40|nr:BREX system P-loop protein BrxC [Gordonia bronchialis]UAK39181.1 BREX system P-loop protein BrxC [Gordonia bronchialis]
MLLNEIFAKDVQRPIEGVIKADDAAHLGTEVEEYVLTNEAAKGVEQLLEAYTNYTNANGVWISGFFGSGKSHLLKMLAHLLGDVDGQEFDRTRVAESFRAKATDSFLPALLTKADRIPAKSILFNIDQKATLISKDQTDALLKVFVKVFDETRGYFGNHGHVARFERDLDSRGQYDAFKEAYERIAGIPWTQGREQSALESVSIDRAFAEVNGEAASGIIKQYQASYGVSIDDFADEVKRWLDTQHRGFRLNFYVDEVGQFIGTNTNLMLDLQTIAETLNTKCAGHAWVIVTSQEDMDKVVGDRTKSQGNDFSKIKDRFKTRVKLTSADVEEVIRKRLLEKNDAGETELHTIYTHEHANFKTLFDFVDGAKTYRNYTDEEHFVGTYPFVSYQFPLFQEAIEGISEHNAFEGRHSSVGERSMLGVVQQVAKDIGNVETGMLATFDHMFAGIRSSLKTAAQKQILTAERNLDNELAVRLLKALFLVKYVDGFQATPRNLTVLVYDRFGLDLPALANDVKEALAELERQTYIQRNGNAFEYLTNEEQVIEEEIKNVDIDASEVSAKLFKILSGDVLKTNKIRYAKNGQDFAFGCKLDDQVHGQQKELSVHFITPDYPHTPDEIRMHSAGKDELRVILHPDERVLSDLRLLLKTDKYTKRKRTTSLSAIEEQILQAKAALNREREKELVQRVQSAVGKSTLIINAADVPASSTDALTRVSEGFQELISRTYTQLKLLGGVTYSEQQIAGAADPERGLFSAEEWTRLAQPADEVLSTIIRKDGQGEQVTMKATVDTFQSKPYGWDLASIEVVVASLIGNSKITTTLDGNVLKRSEVASALRNTQKHSHEILAPQKTYDERKVASFRRFCKDFFDEGSTPNDPLELAHLGSEKLTAKLSELKAIVNGSSAYPFIAQLNGPIDLLEKSVGKSDDWYLSDFTLGDELLDAKDDVIAPIQSFLNGSQRSIYDDASALLATNASNLGYLPVGSDDPVKTALADPNAFRGNRMTHLKQAAEHLRSQIGQIVASKRAEVSTAIAARKDELHASHYYENATSDAQQRVDQRIAQTLDRVASESQIALILQIGSTFESNDYPALLDDLAASQKGGSGGQRPKQTVSVKTIPVPCALTVIETEDQIGDYLAALRSALVNALNDGKRIAL